MANELVVAGLNDAQRIILEQRTPTEAIRYREGRAGMKLAYVSHAWVNRVLNEAFGFRWSWEVLDTLIVPDATNPAEVIVRGRLTVTAPDGGSVFKEQFGTADVKRFKNGGVISLGDDLKAASSDAMKKAASMLGVALDLYGASDEPLPGGQPEPVQPVTKAQATTKQPTNGDKPAGPTSTAHSGLPFRPTVQAAVGWAIKEAPDVWPVDKDGLVVEKAVENSFRKLIADGLAGDALMHAWIDKVHQKQADLDAAHDEKPLFEDGLYGTDQA